MSNSEGRFECIDVLSYTATIGDLAASHSIAALVSARLYDESPTDAERADTSNALGTALQSVTTWATGTSTNEKLITYAAVTDPTPLSTDDYEIYYWVVSFRWSAAGTVINDVVPWLIWRSRGVLSRWGVVAASCYAIEEKLEDLASATIGTKITLAERLVEQDLIALGYDIRRVDRSDGMDLVRYRATSLACQGLANAANDIWDKKAALHKENYDTLLKSLKLGYDLNEDGAIEPNEKLQRSVVMFRG